jgi:hypothetical protein
MLKSALFVFAKSRLIRAVELFVELPFVGTLCMIIVLPLGLLLSLMLGLCAMPGLMLHAVLWSRISMDHAREPLKLVHDASLILLSSVSAALMFLYVLPNVLPEPSDDPRCATHPYC